jgi:hypothetical protein
VTRLERAVLTAMVVLVVGGLACMLVYALWEFLPSLPPAGQAAFAAVVGLSIGAGLVEFFFGRRL